MKKPLPPSDLELQVLAVLWERGPSTARSVLGELPDGKRRAYTTVLSTMQVMEKKGLLGHTVEGKTHVYFPKAGRQQIVGPMLRGLVDRVFGGRPSAALQCLLADRTLDRDQLAEIERLLAEQGTDDIPGVER